MISYNVEMWQELTKCEESNKKPNTSGLFLIQRMLENNKGGDALTFGCRIRVDTAEMSPDKTSCLGLHLSAMFTVHNR